MTSDYSHMSCKQLFKYTKCNYLYTSVNTSGSHSTPPGADGKVYSNRMPVSHKESTVPPTELEVSDTGQLGPSNSSGLLNRLCSHPTPVIPTSPNSSVTGQACTGDTGGSRTVNQGGNSGNYPLTSKFCLPDFPGREKRGGTTTSDQSKGPESICPIGTFQNGGFTFTTRPTPTRGLDGENGPKGCLPPNSHPFKPSTPPPIHLGRETLQVSMPPIWSHFSTSHFHKTAKTSSGVFKTDRLTPHCISGRYADHACQQGPVGGNGTSGLQLLRSPGVDGKYQEVHLESSPTHRVFGVPNQFSNNEIHPTIREVQKDTAGSSKPAQITVNFSTTPSYICREGCCNLQSCCAGPLTLQSSTESTQLHNFQEQPLGILRQVRCTNNTRQRGDDRPPMVVNLGKANSGITHMLPSTSASDRVRRLTTWVGSTMYENQHGRTLVNPRGNPSYQLPGITSSLSGSGNLCKQSAPEGFNSPENRQHLSSNIHKPEGRHTLNSVVQFSLGNLGLVSSTPTNNSSRAPTGQSKLGSRLRIQNDERSVRLDDNPKVFQQICQSLGPLQIDLFASRLTKQLPRYYSWRPDPEAEATDAFTQNWAQARGFANPPWCV